MKSVLRAAVATAAVLGIIGAFQAPALAHERRMVGPYQLVVGWLNEPAFEGQPNAASVRIADTRETPARPVEGLEKTLKLEVVQGGLAPYTGTLRAVFGQPGLYALDVYPTVAGQYRYRITGTIGTTSVNETFESGPTTFNDVQASTDLQYPSKVPVGDELARKLDALQATADRTQIMAIVALLLGLGALGLTAARRRA